MQAQLPSSYAISRVRSGKALQDIFYAWREQNGKVWQRMVKKGTPVPLTQRRALPATASATTSPGVGGGKGEDERDKCDIKSLVRAYLCAKRARQASTGVRRRGAEATFAAVRRLLKSTLSEERLRRLFHQWKSRHPAEWRGELAAMQKSPDAYFRAIVSLYPARPTHPPFQRIVDPDAYRAATSNHAADDAKLPRVVLHLAPSYTAPDGRWMLTSSALFSQAKALLCSQRSEQVLCRSFRAWQKANPDEWGRMVAAAERDPNTYLADIVSSDVA